MEKEYTVVDTFLVHVVVLHGPHCSTTGLGIVLRIRHRVVNEHYLHGSPQLFRVLQRGQKRKPVNLGLQVRVRDIC